MAIMVALESKRRVLGIADVRDPLPGAFEPVLPAGDVWDVEGLV